jgi:membrane protease YdiL (CAAX protease family)
MRRVILRDSSPGLQFVFSLLIVVAAWLVFQLVALLTGALLYNIGFSEIQNVLTNYDNPVYISYQKYVQSVISTGMFIIAPLTIAFTFSNNIFNYLKLNYFPGITLTFLAGLLMILSLPMNNYFTYLNNLLNLEGIFPTLQSYFEDMEVRAENVFEGFLNVDSIWLLLVNILVVAVIPAIGEELLFRGVLQKIFIRWTKNTFIGVVITSIAFAMLHLQFLSVLPRFILSMVLGYMFVWTKSLWIPIIAHFVNNALAVIYYYAIYNGKIGDGIEHIGQPDNAPVYALLSMVIVIILMFVIRRMMRDRINQTENVPHSVN